MATDRRGNIYEGAAGKRLLGQDADMTVDSVFAIFSTTKAITGTACLQLVEEGKLDLDAPAEKYAPEIGKAQVLEGFDAAGKPMLRAPKRAVTTRMLLLHTAGFGYDFFNQQYNRLAKEHGQPSVITSSKAALRSPLLFDPGDDWEYGSNIDWAGQVVEGITGKRLGEVMQERIFAPLGMASSAFTLTWASFALALPPLLQGAIGWAGREEPELTGRPAALCESFLRSLCDWRREVTHPT